MTFVFANESLLLVLIVKLKIGRHHEAADGWSEELAEVHYSFLLRASDLSIQQPLLYILSFHARHVEQPTVSKKEG